MPKCDCNFIEITLRHGCFPVNMLHIFRTSFLKNTSIWLLLSLGRLRYNFFRQRLLLIRTFFITNVIDKKCWFDLDYFEDKLNFGS